MCFCFTFDFSFFQKILRKKKVSFWCTGACLPIKQPHFSCFISFLLPSLTSIWTSSASTPHHICHLYAKLFCTELLHHTCGSYLVDFYHSLFLSLHTDFPRQFLLLSAEVGHNLFSETEKFNNSPIRTRILIFENHQTLDKNRLQPVCEYFSLPVKTPQKVEKREHRN